VTGSGGKVAGSRRTAPLAPAWFLIGRMSAVWNKRSRVAFKVKIIDLGSELDESTAGSIN
jgi:hypothetical protein